MNTYEFLKMAEKEVADSLAIIRKKGESYGAAEDVFFNFRQTAERMFPEMPVHEGMFLVAEILKDKHSVAIAKGMYVNECRERLLDNLNYTLFQLAMIAEAEQVEEFDTNETEANWCAGFPPGSLGDLRQNLEINIKNVMEGMRKAIEAASQQGKSAAIDAFEEANKNINVIHVTSPEQLHKFFEENGEKLAEAIGVKKKPVIVHGCGDCKFNRVSSTDEPCKDCGGWDAATGDTLPGWESENG